MNSNDKRLAGGKSAMTTELPYISSTTSISDNVDLRNYYDKLLFKNNSGKSLTDLPRRAVMAASTGSNSAANSGNPGMSNMNPTHEHSNDSKTIPASASHNEQNRDGQKVDFINGFTATHGVRSGSRFPFTSFQMTPSNSEPTPPTASLPISQGQTLLQQQQQPIFNFNDGMSLGFQQNGGPEFSLDFRQINNNQQSNYLENWKGSFDSLETPMKALSLDNPASQQQSNARRSSYISDTLIHGQLDSVHNSYSNPIYNSHMMNGNSKAVNYPMHGASLMGLSSPPPTAPAAPYGNAMPTYNQQRRHTQPVNSLNAPPVSTTNYSQQSVGSAATRNRYLNYSKQQQQQQHQQQHQQQQQQQHQQPSQQQQQTQKSPDSSTGPLLLDNGLILLASQKLVSSGDLQSLYADCGSHYFSSKDVFQFTDHIKSLLYLDKVEPLNKKNSAIPKFLSFLKSCNLNYNPQSDAFMSDSQVSPKNHTASVVPTHNNMQNNESGNGRERRSNSTSSYLHYKPLVLVALKNGKLELLSTPQNTNIAPQRGDLVIIDGDRGKDLALVVEPIVSLDLALFINFLKKKIHFDSLITSKAQHHANNSFIQALIDSTKGQNEKLNSKLYDVIELTQLIVPSKQVLRFATTWEVSTNLHNKFQDELKALHIAQLKLKSLNSGFSHHHNANSTSIDEGSHPAPGSSSRPQLNIKILNSEFQFDRKKLTFYYVCEERNDFRELIKELFKFYKTRIWLCAIPNNLGIDSKYYDSHRKELQMYQEMMQHYAVEDLTDANGQQGGGFIVAPPLNKIELDNFQIGVYKELVRELFGE